MWGCANADAIFENMSTAAAKTCCWNWNLSLLLLLFFKHDAHWFGFVFLRSDTLGSTTALSSRIRPNNINHQVKRHHCDRGALTKAQHKGSQEMQYTSKKYSVQGSKIRLKVILNGTSEGGPKTLPPKVCQDLVLQNLLPSPSDVQI